MDRKQRVGKVKDIDHPGPDLDVASFPHARYLPSLQSWPVPCMYVLSSSVVSCPTPTCIYVRYM